MVIFMISISIGPDAGVEQAFIVQEVIAGLK